MRNMLSQLTCRNKRASASMTRTVSAQPTPLDAQRQLAVVLSKLERHWGKRYAAVLKDAEYILLAYLALPVEHYLRIRTTNIVKRVNREIKRRTKVVSVLRDAESAL